MKAVCKQISAIPSSFQECNLLAFSEYLHLATFSETLRIEKVILSELTCTRFFWEKISWRGAATAWEFSVKSSHTIFLNIGLTARPGNKVERLTFFIVRSTFFFLDDIEKISDGSFWHIMYRIKANRKDRCVRIYFIVRASVTGIVNNVLGTSLLCQERSWNVAPLQPRLFVVRWPNNTALFSVKKKHNAKLS